MERMPCCSNIPLDEYKWILASKSPRRKELLSRIISSFEIYTSDAEEKYTSTEPGDIVMELAENKAKAVSSKLHNLEENTLIIGSDTIVYKDGIIYGKPKNSSDCKEILSSLSGKTHQVFTGVCILWKKDNALKCYSLYEKTDVTFGELSEKEILGYIATGDPFDKAGGYGIQGVFSKFVKGINGDYFNVIGFPVHAFYEKLKEIGIL